MTQADAAVVILDLFLPYMAAVFFGKFDVKCAYVDMSEFKGKLQIRSYLFTSLSHVFYQKIFTTSPGEKHFKTGT